MCDVLKCKNKGEAVYYLGFSICDKCWDKYAELSPPEIIEKMIGKRKIPENLDNDTLFKLREKYVLSR